MGRQGLAAGERGGSVVGLRAYDGRQQNVAEAVDRLFLKVIVGKVQLESAFEVSDAARELIAAHGCD
jgi:hypothetical protein